MPPSGHKPAKKLNPQQEAFVHALAADPRANGKKAAIAAGYSETRAAVTAHELLHMPEYAHVQLAYEELTKARLARYNMSDEDIIAGLSEIARGDWRSAFQGGPGKTFCLRKDLDDLWPEEMRLIKSIKALPEEQYGTGAVSVTFYSRHEAYVALAKIRGLMRERHEHIIDLRISEAATAVTGRVADLLQRRKAELSPEPGGDGTDAG